MRVILAKVARTATQHYGRRTARAVVAKEVPSWTDAEAMCLEPHASCARTGATDRRSFQAQKCVACGVAAGVAGAFWRNM